MSEAAPEQLSGDDTYLAGVMAEADVGFTNIPPEAARMIASQFHGGQASPFYSFASCGAIDLEAFHGEYYRLYADPNTSDEDKRRLDHLGTFVMDAGNRGAQEGWSELWGRP